VIESIELWNFQGHNHLKVELAQITSLVGNNQAGKSSVLRALKWIFLNEGSVKELCQIDKKWVKAEATVDGHRVTRYNGPKGNLYKLDGKKLKAFHPDVPQPVADLLRVSKDHFQDQLDGPYWFLDTPGQVSRNLNKVVNLEIIDHSLKNADQETKKSKLTVELGETRLRDTRKEKRELSWIKGAERDFAALKTVHKRQVRVGETLDDLREITSELRDLERRGGRKPPNTKRIIAMWKELEVIQDALICVRQLKKNLESTQKGLDEAERRLRQAESELASVSKTGKCPTCGQSVGKTD
jgi:exonuclease SbcC